MKRELATALIALGFSTGATAGSVGAGPAATGSSGVGSVLTPGSGVIQGTESKNDAGNLILPGNGGAVTLSAGQIPAAAATLRALAGAVVEGNIIRAPAVLQDNTRATVRLNTESGELKIVRDDN